MSEPEVTRDEATYRRMREPHESMAAAEEAMRAFYADVRAAREKHKITNGLLVVEFYALDSQGSEIPLTSRMSMGDSSHMVLLAAWLYGQEKRDYSENIGSLLMPKD